MTHLRVVPPGELPKEPDCRGCASRDIVERNLRAEAVTLRRLAADKDYWLDAWQQLLDGVADLHERVGKRRRGRRFATGIELNNLLRKQAAERKEGRPDGRKGTNR